MVGTAALAALEQGEEIRAQPKEGAVSAPADDVQPHQRLVPLDRATHVAHPEGDVIDVDPMQDGIRPGILAVRLGHLILPAHCLGKVVLSAVRIEAGPNVGGPLERFVAMLLENCAHACFVEAVNAGREVVQAGFVALEQCEIVAL